MLKKSVFSAEIKKRGFLVLFFLLLILCGCGTMKTSNTSRTSTEQLLISDAIDKAVDQLDFRVLAGKKVYLNTTALTSVTDTNYLASSIRQQLLASGAMLKEEKKEAEFIVEVRSGGIGTDENDIIYGIPKTTMPTFVSSGTVTIPEIAIAKKVAQNANAKIAVFAYNRETGVPLWQSGTSQTSSRIKNVWFLGGGPYRSGDIIDRPEFASQAVDIPLADLWESKKDASNITLKDQAYFVQNDPEKSEKRDVPVLRLATPVSQPDIAGRIIRPEGLYIPSEEKLIGFPDANSQSEALLAEKKPDASGNTDVKSVDGTSGTQTVAAATPTATSAVASSVCPSTDNTGAKKPIPEGQVASAEEKKKTEKADEASPESRTESPKTEMAQPPVNTVR